VEVLAVPTGQCFGVGLLTARGGNHVASHIFNDLRVAPEHHFKAMPTVSKVKVVACSLTLEMRIDVSGLDAVVLRNI